MKEYIRFIKLFVAKYSGELITGTILASVHMVMLMASPVLTSFIIDKVILSKNMELLQNILVAIIGVLIFTSVLHFLYSILLNKIFLRLGYDMKLYMFQHISKLDISAVNTLPAGMLNYRIFNDSESIKVSLGQIIFGVALNSIYILFICGYMLLTNWSMALFVILVQSLQVALVLASREKLKTLATERKTITESVIARTVEIINSFSLVKACRNEAEEEERFSTALNSAVDKAYKESVLISLAGEFSSIINGTVAFGVLWFGGVLVMRNDLSLGNLTAFIIVGNMLGAPLNAVVNVALGFQDVIASSKRVFEILNMENKIGNDENPITPAIEGKIEFQKVHFSYDNAPVLEDISFQIEPRTVSAIIGRSGVGKTTICTLLSRFYDPTLGSIIVDGHNIKNIELSHYRKNVGIVLQNDFVFSGTIKDNIRMGDSSATDDMIIKAAKMANAHEFISNLPDGYWTYIGERGKQLSGGQAQRISLARLFLQNPKIIILDEATSFIDIESEELIKEAVLRLAENATVLIITHKLSTVKMASKVLVLENRIIAEQGTHEELLENNGLYAKLYKKVLS